MGNNIGKSNSSQVLPSERKKAIAQILNGEKKKSTSFFGRFGRKPNKKKSPLADLSTIPHFIQTASPAEADSPTPIHDRWDYERNAIANIERWMEGGQFDIPILESRSDTTLNLQALHLNHSLLEKLDNWRGSGQNNMHRIAPDCNSATNLESAEAPTPPIIGASNSLEFPYVATMNFAEV